MGIQYTDTSVESGAVTAVWEVVNEGALRSVDVHFDTAPTTVQNIEVHLISPLGDVFSNEIRAASPVGVTDVGIEFDPPRLVPKEFSIEVRYANPDDRTIGITITGSDSIN